MKTAFISLIFMVLLASCGRYVEKSKYDAAEIRIADLQRQLNEANTRCGSETGPQSNVKKFDWNKYPKVK